MYNYVLVRKDLPTCQQIVQASHAAHEAGIHLKHDSSHINYLIVCEVSNEHKLLSEHERIDANGIKCILFREPDIGNQATALCTEPIEEFNRKPFSRYQLWKE